MKKIIFIFLLTLFSIPTSFASVPTSGLVWQWELNWNILDTSPYLNTATTPWINFIPSNGSNLVADFRWSNRIISEITHSEIFTRSIFFKIDHSNYETMADFFYNWTDRNRSFIWINHNWSTDTPGAIRLFWDVNSWGNLWTADIWVNDWEYHHLVWTRDISGNDVLYIDNQEVPLNGTWISSWDIWGNNILLWENKGGTRDLNWQLSLINIYDRVLDISEINQLYLDGQDKILWVSTSIINWKTCEKRYINYEYPSYYTFDINDSTILEDADNLNIYSTNFNITDDNFWQLNLSNFASYSSSSDFISALNGDGNFIVQSWLNPFSSPTVFQFRFNSPVNTVYLEWDWDFVSIAWDNDEDYFYVTDCSWYVFQNPKIWDDAWSNEQQMFRFSEKYTFSEDYYNICFRFDTSWNSDLTINKFLIWTNSWIQFEETLVCAEDDTWDIYYGFAEDGSDLVLFSWPPEDIWKVTDFIKSEEETLSLFWGNELSFIKPIPNWTAQSLSDELEWQFWILAYLEFIDIRLPDIPNLSISVPMIGISPDFKIQLNTYPAEFLPITDTVGASSELNKDVQSRFFISFLLVLFYLSFRFLFLYLIFYIFTIFYKYLDFISVSLFWHGVQGASTWNVFSLAFYVFFLISIFSIFIVLFAYILQFDTIILMVIEYWDALISWLAVSFWDYNFYKNTINFFFSSLVLAFLSYILYQISAKYLKAN